MENEIWKDIPEFEGLYQISNLGRVKSLKRNNILKSFYDKDGYKRVCLYKKIDNKDCRKYKYVHKLVAENFIIDKTKFLSVCSLLIASSIVFTSIITFLLKSQVEAALICTFIIFIVLS